MQVLKIITITIAALFILNSNEALAQSTLKGNEAMVTAGPPAKITKTELTNLITDFKSSDNNKSMKAFTTINEKLMTTLAIQKNEIREASEAGKPTEKLMKKNQETINLYNKINGADANNSDGTLNKDYVLKALNELSAHLFN